MDGVRLTSPHNREAGQRGSSGPLAEIRLSELRGEPIPVMPPGRNASNQQDGSETESSRREEDSRNGESEDSNKKVEDGTFERANSVASESDDSSTAINHAKQAASSPELINDYDSVAPQDECDSQSETKIKSIPAPDPRAAAARQGADSFASTQSIPSRSLGMTNDDSDESPTVISERGIEVDGSLPPMSTRELGAALVGTRLQNYELVEFVGGGGMGAVFRANDLKLGRTVAVKVLARTGPNGELAKRFINEAQSAARLDHENIARVYNVDESAGVSYIVFEFVEGVNLREAVAANGPLSIEKTLRYTMQIADALDHASQRNVIHRDIKPSNILITSTGKVKLVDMGLARMVRLDTADPDLTASGMTLGTFDYISPEQARDPRQADVRSDLYSLGCTMYFMLTGAPPFPDGNAFEKLLHHRERKRPDPRKGRSDVPAELASLIRKLMSPTPSQRFQSPGELMAAMTWHAQKWGVTLTTTPSVERAMASYLNRRSWWAQHVMPIVFPALLMLLAFVVVELVVGRSSPSTQLVSPSYASETTQREVIPAGADDEAADGDSTTNDMGSSAPTGDADGSGAGDGRSERLGSDNDTNALTSGADSGNRTSATDDGDTGASTATNDQGSDESTQGQNSDLVATIDPADVVSLIVGDVLDSPAVDSVIVEDLQTALETADRYPNLAKIELRFDGEHSVESFSLSSGEWLIEAGDGYRPTLVFTRRPIVDDVAMVDISCLDAEWKGIDFVWRVSSGVTVSERALFRMRQNEIYFGAEQKLTFRDCTFTTRFMEDMETLVQPELAMIQIESPNQAEFQLNDARVLAEPPAVDFENCAVRGPVTLVSTPEATPCVLVWNQGLFISNKRLFDCHGSESAALGFRIRILLRNVTVAAQRGLARVAVSETKPDFLHMLITATDCIFETDEPLPLLEHVGVTTDDLSKVLILEGVNNYFPDRSPIWVLRTELDPAPAMIVDFEEAIQDDQWFPQRLYERGSRIRWESPTDERSSDVSRRRLSDYMLREESTNPAYIKLAGFDPAVMTDFPVEADAGPPRAVFDPSRPLFPIFGARPKDDDDDAPPDSRNRGYPFDRDNGFDMPK